MNIDRCRLFTPFSITVRMRLPSFVRPMFGSPWVVAVLALLPVRWLEVSCAYFFEYSKIFPKTRAFRAISNPTESQHTRIVCGGVDLGNFHLVGSRSIVASIREFLLRLPEISWWSV